GRYLTPDPIGLAGGINPYAYVDSVGKPVAGMNPYTYAESDPINFIDPYGLWRFPDYVSINFNIAIPTPWTATLLGGTAQVALDRYGNFYAGPGGTVGKAATIFSLSATVGWLDTSEKPCEKTLDNFLSGHSFNAGAGFWGGGGETWTPGVGTGTEVGFVSPQAGASYHYSWKVTKFGFGW
ncbi:MAG TPA: hypothetical protein PK250_09950, partial [Syntrophobacter fumaroxidans]|nr:hypothetical protein [Syntrophobacter fumaroxidans]